LGGRNEKLTLGLIPAGCPTDDPEKTDPKKIVITGLSGKTGDITVSLALSQTDVVASGTGTISNNSVTVSLKKDT
jgi:hypothetical protein